MRGFVAAAVLTSAVALHAGLYKDQDDFLVFRLAGQRALAGEDLYRADALSPYKYAPAIAFAFAPFAAVPPKVGAWLWLALSVAALLWFMRKQAEHGHGVVALWCLPFSKALFALGQCDAVLLAAMLASEREGHAPPDRDVPLRSAMLSGVLWAGVCAVKPVFLVFLPLALLRREWARLVAFAAAGAALLLAPALRYGFDGNLKQLGAGASLVAGASPMLCSSDNQSVAAMVCTWVADPMAEPALFRAVFVAATLAVLALLGVVARRAPWLAVALAFYCTALLSPHGWRFTLLGLIPLFYLLARDRKWWVWLVPSAAALIGLVGYELVGPELWRTLVAHRMFGILGLITATTAIVLRARVRA